MASAVEYFHPDKPPQLWINEVGVALSHRKQGIGRQLVQKLVASAKDRGCIYAWLGTEGSNLSRDTLTPPHPSPLPQGDEGLSLLSLRSLSRFELIPGTDTDNVAVQACFSSVPAVETPQPFLLYE
jgi:predicted GNAT family acetyltransferase